MARHGGCRSGSSCDPQDIAGAHVGEAVGGSVARPAANAVPVQTQELERAAAACRSRDHVRGRLIPEPVALQLKRLEPVIARAHRAEGKRFSFQSRQQQSAAHLYRNVGRLSRVGGLAPEHVLDDGPRSFGAELVVR